MFEAIATLALALAATALVIVWKSRSETKRLAKATAEEVSLAASKIAGNVSVMAHEAARGANEMLLRGEDHSRRISTLESKYGELAGRLAAFQPGVRINRPRC